MSDFLSQLQYIVSISQREEIKKSSTGEMKKANHIGQLGLTLLIGYIRYLDFHNQEKCWFGRNSCT